MNAHDVTPAFPFQVIETDRLSGQLRQRIVPGMSVRRYVASQVAAGLLAGVHFERDEPKAVAACALAVADAILEATEVHAPALGVDIDAAAFGEQG